MKFIKKSAFTLSEVLITLSLIGFLATMTLATIGSSVQQRARLAEFRTAYGKMDMALRAELDSQGIIPSCYVTIQGANIENMGLVLQASVQAQNADCLDLTEKMARRMGSMKTCIGYQGNCIPNNYPTNARAWHYFTSTHIYVLENGMIFLTMRPNLGSAGIAMDINGHKGPNRWGLDIFPFVIAPSEIIAGRGITPVKNLKILAPNANNDILPTGQLKSTAQLMRESAGMRD